MQSQSESPLAQDYRPQTFHWKFHHAKVAGIYNPGYRKLRDSSIDRDGFTVWFHTIKQSTRWIDNFRNKFRINTSRYVIDQPRIGNWSEVGREADLVGIMSLQSGWNTTRNQLLERLWQGMLFFVESFVGNIIAVQNLTKTGISLVEWQNVTQPSCWNYNLKRFGEQQRYSWRPPQFPPKVVHILVLLCCR